MKIFLTTAGILIVVLGVVATQSLYVVRLTNQALVLQFGNPVAVRQEPGLYYKLPFVQDVTFYDKRVLELDPPEFEVLLTDKKRIIVDGFVRYRITDPLKTYERFKSVYELGTRLGNQVNSSLRRVIATVPLSTILSNERASVMETIKDEVVNSAETLGIEIVDVRIGRTDLPSQTSQAVYSRMRTEREREARELRAEGSELAQKIRAGADKERTLLIADANRSSQILIGEGEGQRAQILAEAFNRDSEFFSFYKSLEQYRRQLNEGTTLVLKPDSEFFEYFGGSTQTR